MRTRARLTIFFLLALSCMPMAAAKDMALVSNKGNAIQGITLADLAKVCKGQTNRWPDGQPVTMVILDPDSGEMKVALQKIYELSPAEVKTLIKSANHSRSNHPAIVVARSDEDLVQKVQSTPGAVGLVDVYSITGGVAVLRVAGKLPLEPGYPLHSN